MPGPCDSILVNSPVNVVMQKRESTFSESYMDWIKTATQQQIQEAQAAGVSVILPTDPPIPLSASITNQQYHDFQTALEAGSDRPQRHTGRHDRDQVSRPVDLQGLD